MIQHKMYCNYRVAVGTKLNPGRSLYRIDYFMKTVNCRNWFLLGGCGVIEYAMEWAALLLRILEVWV